MGMGALDIANIVWMIVQGMLHGSAFDSFIPDFSRPSPPLFVILHVFTIFVYILILACGITLVLRLSRFAWLNYILFPLRLAFFLPTLFPVFMLAEPLGLVVHPYVNIGLLVATEVACCAFIFYWRRSHRRRSSTGASAPIA
jgi:hypothetical protein